MNDEGLFEAAIRKAATNELLVEGQATKDDAAAKVTLEREVGPRAVGVQAGISKRDGWSIGGFYRRIWGGK